MAVIWITGARGFIGRHLAAHLAEQGHEIHGIGHGHWTAEAYGKVGLRLWVNADITAASLGQLAHLGARPDAVIHLAGGSSVAVAALNPHEDFQRTVATTLELLEWTRQNAADCAIIAVSSAAVYGSAHPGPIREEVFPSPYSTYGYHKFMMESLCRNYAQNYGLSVAIPRLFSVYGPGLRKQLLWDLCNKLAREEKVLLGGTGAELRDWIHIHDVQRGLAALLRRASPDAPTINIASGMACSVADVADRLMRIWKEMQNDSGAEQLVFSGQKRAGDPRNLIADVGAMSSWGLTCQMSLEQGLRDYVAWFMRQNQSRAF